jgi:hypothetical protein
MNQRIRELAIEAFFDEETSQTSNKMYNFSEYKLEKFAELIVRECAELTLDHKNDDYYAGWLDYRDEILKHFGVRE